MRDPVRWFHLFSTWIFIASVLYPIHGISTFPLNVLALVGIVQVLRGWGNEHWVKELYIIALHLLPFLWIPYDFSLPTLKACFAFGFVYLIFLACLQTNCVTVYWNLLQEKHTKLEDFLKVRFGWGP